MAKIQSKSKENPRLMQKILKDGRQSLYLDYYWGYDQILNLETGKKQTKHNRSKEFLGLYLIANPRTPTERQHNKETLALASQIRIDKEKELLASRHKQVLPSTKKINMYDFFNEYVLSYTKNDIRMIKTAINRFCKFILENYPSMQNHLKPEYLDKEMMERFVEYLQSISKGEGAKTFYSRFKKIIKYCVEKDIILKNPCIGVTCVVDDSALTKEVLSLAEIKILSETPYHNEEIRRAFLFCLYAGLRHCDLIDLKFSNVDFSNKRIKFEQSKTKGHSKNSIVIIPLSNTLLQLIGEKPDYDDYIFHLPSHTGCLKALKTWVHRAGIDKHITWHCARHSFAVNLLGECGTDIKTVASLLGHSGLKHTEKYTRAVDSLKVKAVNSLPELEM